MRRWFGRPAGRRIGPALAAVFLVLLYAAALGAGFLAPYGYEQQDRERSYAPPVHPHWLDAGGRPVRGTHWRPPPTPRPCNTR